MLQRVAAASLIALMLVSIALASGPVSGEPTGAMLAVVKIIVLGFLLTRIRRVDVYAMQWSSMFILLFVAEGVVRAMSDRQPSAALGLVEAIVSSIYFIATLVYLRPLKQASRKLKR